ncbi:MAG: hypothetical protein OXF89_03570 [Rhodospirillaceae bacterium]|nr:hypothetical protein [Rhodospirillaceae bacterium]
MRKLLFILAISLAIALLYRADSRAAAKECDAVPAASAPAGSPDRRLAPVLPDATETAARRRRAGSGERA